MKTKKKTQRSKNFVPQLLIALESNPRFTCKFTDLPLSYQAQPYNLAAKLDGRGGMKVNVIFNKAKNTFVVIRQIVTSQKPTTNGNSHAI